METRYEEPPIKVLAPGHSVTRNAKPNADVFWNKGVYEKATERCKKRKKITDVTKPLKYGKGRRRFGNMCFWTIYRYIFMI